MIVVYDIETLFNCFVCVCMDVKTMEKRVFVIHKSRNDFKELVQYIKALRGMVGFNNVGFDYPVLHPYLSEPEKYQDWNGDRLAKSIYKRAQKIIESEERDWNKPIIEQRDLFLIWHFNNKARSTSLKWLQVCMGWKNVQEMPIPHQTSVTAEQITTVIEYCDNDVETTFEFYKRSHSRIILRKTLSEKYNVNMGNYSDNKIGEEIFLRGISAKTGMSVKNLKQGRTYRPRIVVKDLLLNLDFCTREFREVYERYKEMIITGTKKEESISCVLDGMVYEFGFGGLHACRGNGVYKNITSADVKSYYPNLAISLRLSPKHLGEDFCEVYKELYEQRKLYKKGTDENEAIKLALNGIFGQSNADWSPFYDPAFTMSVTLNGQFLLALLCERITESLAGKIVMVNTDGIEVDVLDQSEFDSICKQWQLDFGLELEFNKYQMLAVRDVNNYLAIDEKGKVKDKGDFEIEREIYKNQSMPVVRIAVREYFTNKTPIEQTINNCNDIGMFVLGHRAKTGNLSYRSIDGYDLLKETLPKNVRYYISNSGGAIVKVTKQEKKSKTDISPRQISMFDTPTVEGKTIVEKITKLHVGYKMTLFNKWVDRPFEEYGVDKRFYINEAQKLINSVVNTQL